MNYLKFIILSLLTAGAFAQEPQIKPLNILFLGNSYTYVNSLPQICVGVAASAGDVLFYDNYTPGGYKLQQHASDSNAIKKIMQGRWNFVVLQEQSQLASFTDAEVARDVLPYAHFLDSLIHWFNPGSKTVFYMTWGRKNGDTARCKTWPPVCSYRGMDSLLALRYTLMAKLNHSDISPVGAVWRYLREKYPSIELYLRDESHPSEAGSYAAACCFYTIFFQKDPAGIDYNYTLNKSDALKIRNAVRKVVFNDLAKWKFN
jgi:Domain of unknown function (DUF4886)